MKVMHYYTNSQSAGGPLTYIRNIEQSKYLSDIEFKTCFQEKAGSNLTRSDFKRIVNEIKDFAPDILHIHGVQTEGYIGVKVGKKAKVPHLLMTVHGLQHHAEYVGGIKKFILKNFIESYALKKAEATYCVCDDKTKNPYVIKHAKKLLPTIHNFIKDEFFEQANSTLDVDTSNKVIITTVCRVCVDKGMIEFEKCILNDKNENTVYWVVGDGEYLETMKNNLKKEVESGKVVFWGQRDDVKSILQKSHVFLFLTHHENLSIALLEAAASGCCCIATDVGGNSEIVQGDGDGFLIDAYDYKKANLIIDQLAKNNNLIEECANKLKEKVINKFSEKAFSQKLRDLYNNLIEGK